MAGDGGHEYLLDEDEQTDSGNLTQVDDNELEVSLLV